MTRTKYNFPPLLIRCEGISVIGVAAFIICLIIVITVTLLVLRAGKRAAYEITAKHDLRQFVEFEKAYYAENDEYLGEEGDIISNDPDKTSALSLEEFTPSDGVTITIISDDPFIVISKHNKSNVVFEYNFEEGIIKQRQEEEWEKSTIREN